MQGQQLGWEKGTGTHLVSPQMEQTHRIDFDYILLWVGLEIGDGDWIKTGIFSNWFSATTIFVFGNKMYVLPLKFSFVSHRDPPERDLQERYFSSGIEQCLHQTKT